MKDSAGRQRTYGMEIENRTLVSTSWLDRPLAAFLPRITVETLVVGIILLLAIVSRFAMVGERVMSHDEVNHVVPSYDLFQGRGYRHDPITHGPLQFHLLALSYFLFGDSDTASRIPSATFSIVTVAAVMFLFRRYLGRSGAIIASLLFLISPYLLFYGRYTRNEAFVALWGVLTLFAVFRYLDNGKQSSLFVLTAATVLHFTTKETVYIYMAQLLLFLLILFLEGVATQKSTHPAERRRFIILMTLAIVLLLAAIAVAGYAASTVPKGEPSGNQPAQPIPTPSQGLLGGIPTWEQVAILGSVGGALIFAVLALFFLVRSIGWKGIRSERAFDLLMLVGTLVLPQLVAFPIKMIGWDPLDYTTTGLLRTGIIIALLVAISVAIGLWWKPRLWLMNAALFYTIFVVFYTTFFTNGRGFWTGMVGSLGYWLSQQSVQRGTQPLYYYALIQIPIYEYLAALGTLLALYFGIRYRRFATWAGFDPARQPQISPEMDSEPLAVEPALEDEPHLATPAEAGETRARRIPVLSMLLYWAATALLAYSFAGERMPWLTVHIALPMLLAAGWGLGFLVDSIPWKQVFQRRGIIALLLLPVFLASTGAVLGSLLGATPPFQGNALEQLESTNAFIMGLVVMLATGAGIIWLLREFSARNIVQLAAVTFFALLAVLTARTAYKANYINYDTAFEYLVYAHAARGPKDILQQVEEISRRTTGAKDIAVAYDADALYPYWWYFRDYPNKRYFTDNPTRDLRNMAVIIASEPNYAKLDSITKDEFVSTEYMRLWWPNQDYYNLTGERILYALTNREMRAAIFDIWLNRDYTKYSEAKAKITEGQYTDTFKLNTWQPSSRFRMYIRKDIVAQIWNYGAAPALPVTETTDPYVAGSIELAPDATIGMPGTEPGQFQKPRGLRVAADGSIYVADAGNNRVQHLAADGSVLHTWGTFADISKGNAPGGTFFEPWDVALGPDGSVYVSDTWNHRVQKFTADGQFIKMWGYFGTAEAPDAFWGPRGLAVDARGRVYVMDTGNKRVVVFDADGNFVTQFGSAGMDPGQFDEPVGVALDADGNVYITDTWNQRIQVFQPTSDGAAFVPLRSWDVSAWNGQSLDNKPFITVGPQGNVYINDPEGYRIIEFDNQGKFIRAWGGYSAGADGFGLASGVALDGEGHVWASDAGNNRLLRFTLPK